MYAIAIALCVLLLSGSLAHAQNQPTTPAPTETATPLDPQKLPGSIDRIRKELSQPADKPSGLRIQRIVEVVGVAPPITLWSADERARLASAPSPFGAPTHRQMLDLNTPQEFKRYPIDLNAVMRWLAERLGDSSSKEPE
jgi:hypothetical protein